jgi:methionyl-tRNA formyltransferase
MEQGMHETVLIGMGPTALSALESLLTRFKVTGIIRDSIEPDDPVAARARQLSIELFPDVSPRAVEEAVTRLRPNLVVISSYHRILKAELIARCPFLNVHYAPLPRYRGRAVVNWAVLNNEPCAAISIHQLAPELDAGNVLFQRLIPIRDTDTIESLYETLNEIQREHLAETAARFLAGERGMVQAEEEASYACSRVPEDGLIDWCDSTRNIINRVRALIPPYGAYTFFQGKQLMILKAEAVPQSKNFVGRVPGRVVNVARLQGYVEVLTGDGVLRISEVQFAGEPATVAANVIQSVRGTLGLSQIELLRRIETLEAEVARLISARSPER